MADAAAARREARRQKILENSKNRLKLITGECSELNNDVQVVNNDKTIIKNTHIDAHTEPEQQENIETFLVTKTPINHEFTATSTSSSLTPTTTTTTSSNNITPYSKRIFFALLAVIIRLLFIFQMQFCVRDSIIYPFIVAEVTVQLMFNKDSSKSEIVSPLLFTVLMFSRVPPIQLARSMWLFKLLDTFLQDFSVYFFTFIAVHLCLSF